MNRRNYNPLNEGYSGGKVQKNDFGKSRAPLKVSLIKSAIVKPDVSQQQNKHSSKN